MKKEIFLVLILLCFVVSFVAPVAGEDWYTGYTYRNTINIDEAQINETLTDFPILVVIPDTFNYSRMQSDGDDIRFTNLDSNVTYKYELDALNTTGKSYIWVKIPSISATTDTNIYMYYGNSSVSSGADKRNTWSSDYREVWHLQTTNNAGSTSNYVNLTSTIAQATDSGNCPIGKCYFFNKSTYDRAVASSFISFLSDVNYTVEYMVKKRSNPITIGTVFSNSYDSGATQYQMHGFIDSSGNITYRHTSSGIQSTIYGAIFDSTTWHHVMHVYGGSTLRLYVDGVFVSSTSRNANTVGNTSFQTVIGAMRDRSAGSSSYQYHIDGWIDEVRIYNNNRASGWVASEFANLNKTLVTFNTTVQQQDECAKYIKSISDFNTYTTPNKIVCINTTLTYPATGIIGLEFNATNLTLKCKSGGKININQTNKTGIYIAKDQATVQDCEIYNQKQGGVDRVGIYILNDNTTLKNVTLHGMNSWGIDIISNADYTTIYNSKIYDVEEYDCIRFGDYHTGESSPPFYKINVTRNKIWDCANGAGIRVDYYSSNATIYNNTIHNVKYGIHLVDNAKYTNTTKVTIYNSTDYAIYTSSEHGGTPQYNTFNRITIKNGTDGFYNQKPATYTTFTNSYIQNMTGFAIQDKASSTITNITIGDGEFSTRIDVLSGLNYGIQELLSLSSRPADSDDIDTGVKLTNLTSGGWLNLKMYYTQSDFSASNCTNESELDLWKYTGSVWSELTNVLNITGNYLTSNITAFSSPSLTYRIFGIFGETVTDADGDGYNSTVDCNDSNNQIWTNLTGYYDGDLDSYGVNPSVVVCTNGTLPANYTASNTYLDCDNTNATWRPIQNETTTYINTDIYICPHIYDDPQLLVNATNITIDCNGSTLDADPSASYPAIKSWNYLNKYPIVKNCNLYDYNIAIDFRNISGVTVYNNFVNNSLAEGIFVKETTNEIYYCNVTNNEVNNSVSYPIRIDCNNATVNNNTLRNNSQAFLIEGGNYVTVNGNDIRGATLNGFWVANTKNSNFLFNYVTGSSCDYALILDYLDTGNTIRNMTFGGCTWDLLNYGNGTKSQKMNDSIMDGERFNIELKGTWTLRNKVSSLPTDPANMRNISHYIEGTNYTSNAWVYFWKWYYDESDWNTTGILHENTLGLWRNEGGNWYWNTTGGVQQRSADLTNNYLTANYTKQGTFAPLGSLAPTVTFISQTPADINSTNLFNNLLTIKYNMTSTILEASDSRLFSKTNNSVTENMFYVNGSSVRSGWQSSTGSNVSATFTFTRDETYVYPAIYNIDQIDMDTIAHSAYDLDTIAEYIKIKLDGLSNSKRYTFFEVMAMNQSATSLPLRIYYCNSTYSTGNPATSTNCYNFGSLDAGNYSHSHTANSKHSIISMPINTSTGKIGNVAVTSTSYILLRGVAGANAWNVYYVNNVTNTDQIQTSANSGTSWSNFAGTIDAHIHQYTGTEKFYYYACGNDTYDEQTCSAIRSDNLDLTPLPPTAPSISVPTNTTYFGTINVTYTASVSPQGYDISNYNITLNYPNNTFIDTLRGTGTSLYYEWDSRTYYPQQYVVKVQATDNSSLTATGTSDVFTLVSDQDLDGYNSTVDCNDTNATIWQNLTGYLDTDLDGYGVNPAVIVCSGASLPLNYVSNNTYLDCLNTNASWIPLQNNTNYYVNDDIYICAGTINNTHILFNASNKKLECNNSIFDGYNETGIGASTNGKTQMNIKNCQFRDYQSGIYIGNNSANLINITSTSNDYYGINFAGTGTNLTMTNSTISENGYQDIHTSSASICTNSIFTNNIGSGSNPITLYRTDSASISDLTLSEAFFCADNLAVNNITLSASSSLDNNQIYILNSDNSVYSDLTSSNNYYGLYIVGGNNTEISDSTFSNNIRGVYSSGATYLRLHDNTISSNAMSGINLFSSSTKAQITDNSIHDNNYGINIASEGATIARNYIYDNSHYDIVTGNYNATMTSNYFGDSSDYANISHTNIRNLKIKRATAGQIPSDTPTDDPIAINDYMNITNSSTIDAQTIRFTYLTSDLATIKENTIGIYNFKNNVWTELTPSTLNTTSNYIEASIDHYSILNIFGELSTNETGGGGGGGGGGGILEGALPACNTTPSQLIIITGEELSSAEYIFTTTASKDRQRFYFDLPVDLDKCRLEIDEQYAVAKGDVIKNKLTCIVEETSYSGELEVRSSDTCLSRINVEVISSKANIITYFMRIVTGKEGSQKQLLGWGAILIILLTLFLASRRKESRRKE